MSDRTVIALATVPMLSGALLLVALQRVPPVRVSASAQKAGVLHAADREKDAPAWLGVVVAGHTADLASDSEGRVEEVRVRAGTRVTKGQTILQIDTRDASQSELLAGAELDQRKSEVARAEAAYEEAKAKVSRLEAGGTWIAAQELDGARAAERMAKAALHAARAGVGMGRARMAQQKLRARRLTIEAPFDGVLVACDVDPGDSVAPGQLLARVISDDRQVRFAFPREELPKDGKMNVVLALPGGESKATVDSLQPEVDPSAQMIFASATPSADAALLLPGTRVEVRPAPDPERTSVEGR